MAEVTRALFEELRSQVGAEREFVVVSGSMEPLIRIGEKILVQVGAEPSRFDVVAFWGEDRLTCHVLWHVNRKIASDGERVYLTCPLSRGGLDLAIKESDVLGPVRNFRLRWWHKLRLIWRFRR